MIIFDPLLTTFEESINFWGSSKNWLEPKTKPPLPNLTKLSLSKSMKHFVEEFQNFWRNLSVFFSCLQIVISTKTVCFRPFVDQGWRWCYVSIISVLSTRECFLSWKKQNIKHRSMLEVMSNNDWDCVNVDQIIYWVPCPESLMLYLFLAGLCPCYFRFPPHPLF